MLVPRHCHEGEYMQEFMKLLKLFFTSFGILILFDIIWLGFIMKDFYKLHLADKARVFDSKFEIQWMAAFGVWALLIVGQLVFVYPKVINTSISTSFLWGALFGFIAYGIYDLTNYATLRGWSLQLTVVDMLWGSIINGLIAVLLFKLNTIIH